MNWIEEKQLLMLTVFDALTFDIPARWLRIPVGEALVTPLSYKVTSDKVRFILPEVDGKYIDCKLENRDYIFCVYNSDYLAAVRIDSKLIDVLEWDLIFIDDPRPAELITQAWELLYQLYPERNTHVL